MNCPRKQTECKPSILFRGKGDNLICSGISKKPSRYRKDNVWLCLQGAYGKTYLEMTKQEALMVISALAGSVGNA